MMKNHKTLQTQVLIIGGGATGTGIARDLALRGIHFILVEKADINAGASGGNHGLLHSGARYVGNDKESARECKAEGDILKKMAPHCIDDTGGLFVAVAGDDERYIENFQGHCAQCGLPVAHVDVKDALEMEPALSKDIISVYAVEDASIDPFRLSLDNIAQAVSIGGMYLRQTKVVKFNKQGKKIISALLHNDLTHEDLEVDAKYIINATGAWAGEVAKQAGLNIEMLCSKGTLLVTHTRMAQRVINRLRPPADGDILVPGGTVSILGTTSVTINQLDDYYPTIEEVDLNIEQGAKMVPNLETVRYIRSYVGVRPLLRQAGSEDSRQVSRGFACIDHAKEGVDNFITITGGKLTTYRLMAQVACDLICRKMGINKECRTHIEPLPASNLAGWIEPGFGPKIWMQNQEPDNPLLCECEMIPRKAIDDILASIDKQQGQPSLIDISRRSRVGKGACQGAFCGMRILAHMYDKQSITGQHGLTYLKEFLQKRFRGERPMLWDTSAVQAELQEAMYCGSFSLELAD